MVEDQNLNTEPEVTNTVDETGSEPDSMTLKQLQAEAIKLGMPAEDAEKLPSKGIARSVINTLKSVGAQKEVEKVNTIEENPNPSEEKAVNRQWKTKAEIMRDKLEKQPKVRFFLPLTGEEKAGVVREVMVKGRKEQVVVSGAVEVVQLNGFKTFVPKGRFVELPQQVADVLSESMMATQQAGADLLIDRVDPKTGQPVQNQL
jgi:hypothetical protein